MAILVITLEVNTYRAIEAFLFLLVLLGIKGLVNLHRAPQRALWLKLIPTAVGFLEVPSGVEWVPLVVAPMMLFHQGMTSGQHQLSPIGM